jgi:hypothetical protein
MEVQYKLNVEVLPYIIKTIIDLKSKLDLVRKAIASNQ